jgi:dTMP kinase
MAKGKFITFEGLDGAGKSTHLSWFASQLEGVAGTGQVVLTREPGGTLLGEDLRAMLLARPMHPETEALLMFAARREHLASVIQPALMSGKWVLCDRFTDASYAYQCGGRGIPFDRLKLLEDFTHPDLRPDLTVLFDLDPETARQRRLGARNPDKFESQPHEFHQRTRDAYLKRVQDDPARFSVIDAGNTFDEIQLLLKKSIITI